MSDKLLHLFHKYDRRYKFSKPNMSQSIVDLFPVDQDELFKPEEVEKAVKDLVNKTISEQFIYDAEKCANLCITLSEDVRKIVKEFNFGRYKHVCLVQIFEKKNQSIKSVARFLCDVERDRFVVIREENSNVYVIVSVYGFYYP